MKKVKLDYQYTDYQRGKQRSRSIATYLQTMFKLENIMILVLIVLAHQIHGIYSQGKFEFVLCSELLRKCFSNPNVVTIRKS